MPKMVRKKSFDRTVVKKCPKCEQQLPVACKSCPCGHHFSKKPSTSSSESISENHNVAEEDSNSTKIRRTERTRRERPDFFNPMVLENQAKRARKKSQNSTVAPVEIPQETPKKKRGRPKGTPNKTFNLEEAEKESEKAYLEEDMFANLLPEKALQFSFILEDLNRKFLGQSSQPS